MQVKTHKDSSFLRPIHLRQSTPAGLRPHGANSIIQTCVKDQTYLLACLFIYKYGVLINSSEIAVGKFTVSDWWRGHAVALANDTVNYRLSITGGG